MLIADLEENAHGLSSYSISDINSERYRLIPEGGLDAKTQDICFGQGSQFFIQLPCDISDEEVKERKLEALLIGAISVSCALFITIYVDYLE